ncbi:MAG: helix-turn-helix domain-containing protein [Methanoregula sp.]|jgi:excisionase family DNA binding protein
MDDNIQMLNPRQVAEILGVHQKTVHLWLRTGRLQGTKISYRAWRIPRTALDSFIANNSNSHTSPQKKVPSKKQNTTPITGSTQEQKTLDHDSNAVSQPQSPQSRMKHYIRDIMGERTSDE